MKNANRMLAAVSGSALLLSAASLSAQDWPQWRGVNRDAKVAGFTAPKTWPKELTQKWKVTVGQSDTTPALVGDKLYVFTRQEATEVTLCLDATTGKELWRDKYEVLAITGPASGHAGPRCSPVVANGKVVTVGVRGTITCFDAANGSQVWRKDDFNGSAPQFFTASSPLIVDGLVIAQLGGRGAGAIVAYDLSSGEQKWKLAGEGPGYASPAVMTVGSAKLIIAQTENRMVAVTATDGKLAWEAPFAVQGRGYNASTPVIDGQTIIYTGSSRGTKAVKLEKSGDGFAGKELWSNANTSAQFNSPVLRNGLLFGITQNGEFFCINAQSGQTAWTAAAPEAEGGGGGGGKMRSSGGYGSIVDAGPVLLALTPKSQLLVLEPSDKEYKELASIKVAARQTYGYPVVSGKRVFVTDQDSLTLWTID